MRNAQRDVHRLSCADQMDQVKSEMAELVNARKRAEADMQLLANRLAHLRVRGRFALLRRQPDGRAQSEEEKANKRIEETRARAAEIREAKRRSRMRAQQRQQARPLRPVALSQRSAPLHARACTGTGRA